MSDWIPTTEQVRDGYRYDPEYDYYHPLEAGANIELRERAFDRWLEQVKTEARTGMPARSLPTQEQIAEAIYRVLKPQYGDFCIPTDAADAVLALLKGQEA